MKRTNKERTWWHPSYEARQYIGWTMLALASYCYMQEMHLTAVCLYSASICWLFIL